MKNSGNSTQKVKSPPRFFLFYHFRSSFKNVSSSMSWLGKLGLGFGNRAGISSMDASSTEIACGPDDDVPAAGQQLAQFGAGCFWGVELAFQRVPGVTKTEVGYSQGTAHNPTYEGVCTGKTGHSEIVRLQYDPNQCRYEDLLEVFWARHDPTTLNRQVILLSLVYTFLFTCDSFFDYLLFNWGLGFRF